MARRLPAPQTLSLTYHLFAACQQIGTLLDEVLVDAPLDATRYAIYSAVRETQPTSPTDLARVLGMPVTTALDALASMQRRGHVARLRNPADGRSYLVRLTDEGEAVHDETGVVFSEAEQRLVGELGKQAATTAAALQAVKGAAERALADLRASRRSAEEDATAS